MSFSEAISSCFSKYFVCSGRATRSEFWNFKLFYVLLLALIGGAEVAVYYYTAIDVKLLNMIYAIVDVILLLVFFFPNLAVDIRRLHDSDASGAWLLLGILPVIGTLPLIVRFCTDSSFGCNHYGDNPKHLYRASDGSRVYEISPTNGVNPYHQPWKDG